MRVGRSLLTDAGRALTVVGREVIPLSSPSCSLRVETEGPLVIIHLAGRVQSRDHFRLREEIRTHLKSDLVKGALLDLSEVPYLDSLLISFLISMLKLVRAQGRGLAVVGLNAPCLAALRVASLHRILPIFDTPADARRHLTTGEETP